MKYLGKRNASSIILRPIDEYEIIEINEKLNYNKSTGYINILIVLFKEAKSLIACYLADTFNKYLKTNHYPDVLKIAKLILFWIKADQVRVGKLSVFIYPFSHKQSFRNNITYAYD